MTEMRIKYTYRHQTKEGVELEVIGTEERIQDGKTLIRRIDGYIVDVPTDNILTKEELN